MNSSKAKEHFSEYYEGTLDAHLLASFEAELERNPALQRDWSDFVAAMESLNELREIEIPIPADLNERISMRLDRHIWEAKQSPAKTSMIGGWWKSLALGGVAATALLATILTFNNRSASYTAGANQGDAPLVIRALGNDVEVIAQSRENTKLVVRDAQHSTDLKTLDVNRQRVRSVIRSSDVNGRVVTISLGNYERAITIALPGKNDSDGSGTVAELGLAVASARNRPVVVEATDLSAKVTWDSDVSQMKLSVKPIGFQIQSRDGVLYLVADADISAR